MKKQITYPSFEELMAGHEQTWLDLYELLHFPVTLYVHTYAAPTWNSQPYDLIEDIVQEVVTRLYGQIRLAEMGRGVPIRSIESFCHIMVRNYCRDLWRKERRVSFFPQEGYAFDVLICDSEDGDLFETVLDELTTAAVLKEVAMIIAAFPEKQRTALLIDLARYNDFSEEPTLLEQALAGVEIDLAAYRDLLPQGIVERSRHNALLSHAYRRLRETFHEQCSDLAA